MLDNYNHDPSNQNANEFCKSIGFDNLAHYDYLIMDLDDKISAFYSHINSNLSLSEQINLIKNSLDLLPPEFNSNPLAPAECLEPNYTQCTSFADAEYEARKKNEGGSMALTLDWLLALAHCSATFCD